MSPEPVSDSGFPAPGSSDCLPPVSMLLAAVENGECEERRKEVRLEADAALREHFQKYLQNYISAAIRSKIEAEFRERFQEYLQNYISAAIRSKIEAEFRERFQEYLQNHISAPIRSEFEAEIAERRANGQTIATETSPLSRVDEDPSCSDLSLAPRHALLGDMGGENGRNEDVDDEDTDEQIGSITCAIADEESGRSGDKAKHPTNRYTIEEHHFILYNIRDKNQCFEAIVGPFAKQFPNSQKRTASALRGAYYRPMPEDRAHIPVPKGKSRIGLLDAYPEGALEYSWVDDADKQRIRAKQAAQFHFEGPDEENGQRQYTLTSVARVCRRTGKPGPRYYVEEQDYILYMFADQQKSFAIILLPYHRRFGDNPKRTADGFQGVVNRCNRKVPEWDGEGLLVYETETSIEPKYHALGYAYLFGDQWKLKDMGLVQRYPERALRYEWVDEDSKEEARRLVRIRAQQHERRRSAVRRKSVNPV